MALVPKSRVQWMELGNRNIRFYHASSITRCKSNKTEVLKLDDGVYCLDLELNKSHARAYFVNLFGASELVLTPLATNS